MRSSTNNLFYGTQTYNQRFAELCEPIKQYMGIRDVAYLNVNQKGDIMIVHSNYKWMERYIKDKHYEKDRHLVHPDNMSKGFCMLMINDGYTYQEYNDAVLIEHPTANKFDYGFTYVEKTNETDFTAFCFTVDNSNHRFINTLLNQSEIIRFLIQKLHDQVKTSFPELQDHKAQLIPLKGDLFFQQRGIVCPQ